MDQVLSPEEREWLRPWFFDEALQEGLMERFQRGTLSFATNVERGFLEAPPADVGVPLPPRGSPLFREALEAGETAFARGWVALLVLNGGMATRFGGEAKGAVEVARGVSFLGLKIWAARRLTEQYGAPVPVYLMNSISTHHPTLCHLEGHGSFGHEPVRCFLQNTLLRLNPDGTLFRHADGRLSPYAPGHGDVVEAVARSVGEDMRRRGVRVVQVSNVDNLLATPDPLLVGLHLLDGMPLSVEVVPNTGTDVGGGPAFLNGRLQVVEGFRFPPSFDQRHLPYFNANTLYLDMSCFSTTYDLSWFVVRKRVEEGDVIQFERLAGQLTAFLPWRCRVVAREGEESRFAPIKDKATLHRLREGLWEILAKRGMAPVGLDSHG